PIQAWIREPSAKRSAGLQIDPKSLERLSTIPGEAIRLVGACRVRRHPSQCLKAIEKRYAQCSRHVIVTGPCGAEPARSVWHEFLKNASGDDAQTFQCTRHVSPFQTVIAMFALDEDLD